MKIVTIVGARPQFIKTALVSKLIRQSAQEVLVHTGQHYDAAMSDVFFEELEIPRPEISLGIGSGRHGQQTGRMLEAIEGVLVAERPDWVLVYGDTNSTLAGALAAVKLHIPVAHVEAGLRSFNRRMPEEINRILTDHASTMLFAPTTSATTHLRSEGCDEAKIQVVGDVMYDVALYYGARAEGSSRVLQRLGLSPQGYILATVHRAENTDSPARLAAILEGLASVARELPVVLPLHPRTRAVITAEPALAQAASRLQIIDPVGYLDMLLLEKSARLIATDSGGVQKEAFFYRVPCATLRDETEWTELVELGWNRLISPISADAISAGIWAALAAPPGQEGRPYGDGTAAEQITNRLKGGRP